jgi:hypothetical protein
MTGAAILGPDDYWTFTQAERRQIDGWFAEAAPGRIVFTVETSRRPTHLRLQTWRWPTPPGHAAVDIWTVPVPCADCRWSDAGVITTAVYIDRRFVPPVVLERMHP